MIKHLKDILLHFGKECARYDRRSYDVDSLMRATGENKDQICQLGDKFIIQSLFEYEGLNYDYNQLVNSSLIL